MLDAIRPHEVPKGYVRLGALVVGVPDTCIVQESEPFIQPCFRVKPIGICDTLIRSMHTHVVLLKRCCGCSRRGDDHTSSTLPSSLWVCSQYWTRQSRRKTPILAEELEILNSRLKRNAPSLCLILHSKEQLRYLRNEKSLRSEKWMATLCDTADEGGIDIVRHHL